VAALPVVVSATKYPATAAMTITVPPMVGVPLLVECSGPSTRICWP
jgi:hypothetical protein